MPQTKRHKVFISYFHRDDQKWKDLFAHLMGDRIVDVSVDIGDIAGNSPPTEDTLRHIREEHISQATVTVVLIGPRTWQRKYVDWEIGATLRDTRMNPRCGLLGILLPSHPDFNQREYDPHLIPPRLADNCDGDNSYAHIYNWSNERSADTVQDCIHRAFKRRRRQPDPNNSRLPFARNWNRPHARGWIE